MAESGPAFSAFGRRRRLAIGLALLVLGAGCSGPPEAPPDLAEAEAEESTGAAQPQVDYQVAFEGIDDAELLELLNGVSETVRLVDRPPPSLIRLRRRAEDDRARLEQALRSRGYYDSAVGVAIEAAAEPVRVTFDVSAGSLYQFRDVTVAVAPSEPAPALPGLAELGLAPGEPAVSQTILDAENALLARARAQGHALAELGERRAVVDHGADAMDLTLALRPGPLVRFGEIRVEGLETVEEDAVRRRVPWQPGEVITAEQLAAGREALFDSGLFSSVVVDLGTEPGADGRLPVTVELNERRHRSVGLGVRYRTDEGPGGTASFEHRNLFGRGERLAIELDGSFIGGRLTGSFRKPDFWRRDQALIADTRLAYENTDAFESLSAGASAGLERLLAPGMTISAKLAFRASRVQERGEENEEFGLFSLPVLYQWDRSDDLLNPTRGGRLAAENEPFVDVFGNDLAFNKSRLTYTHYLKVLDSPGVVLAGRGSVGTLFGASRDEVPADLRFYAGGGGSVRGFGFQLAGDLDEDHNPIGGRSLLELSGEVRLRLTETIGVAAFVDAGTAFSKEVPDFSETLRVGAGPGLRYFSPIGPVRLDIGFPVNARDSDDSFQLYVSIGQAF
ncbi:MAG TPA: autotransporter assembly complex family protein [Geminicoccaceae bacterium]|nr:autotransporter assembly complex family protein [Geminicoccaceae bacterium]